MRKQLLFKLTQLEVTGSTKFLCEWEFNQLKALVEDSTKDGVRYSLRKCTDKPGYCETFIE